MVRGRSFSIVFQHGLQAFAGEEYAALHCAERKTHLLGYLAVFIAGYIH